jgi:uncharacterized protein
MKSKGKIKSIGTTTHSVAVATITAENNLIDIVFPIINMNGMGLLDGTKQEIVQAFRAKKIDTS